MSCLSSNTRIGSNVDDQIEHATHLSTIQAGSRSHGTPCTDQLPENCATRPAQVAPCRHSQRRAQWVSHAKRDTPVAKREGKKSRADSCGNSRRRYSCGFLATKSADSGGGKKIESAPFGTGPLWFARASSRKHTRAAWVTWQEWAVGHLGNNDPCICPSAGTTGTDSKALTTRGVRNDPRFTGDSEKMSVRFRDTHTKRHPCVGRTKLPARE